MSLFTRYAAIMLFISVMPLFSVHAHQDNPVSSDNFPDFSMPGENESSGMLDEIIVHGRKLVTAASNKEVRERDFSLLPIITEPGDMLRVVPGLITIQHAGGGKADQYFLRGFDAD